jgi:hypothetical protein
MVRTATLGSLSCRWNCDSAVATSRLGIIRCLRCGVLLAGCVRRLAHCCATFHAAKTSLPSAATSPDSNPWHWPDSVKETTVIVAKSRSHSMTSGKKVKTCNGLLTTATLRGFWERSEPVPRWQVHSYGCSLPQRRHSSAVSAGVIVSVHGSQS